MNLKANIWSFLNRIKRSLTRESLGISYRLLRNHILGIQPSKRAFLVLAPESHGSHLVTDILINAGCKGHSGSHVPWEPHNRELLTETGKPWEQEFPTDLQPWDKKLPTHQDPIVWRRSIPHGKDWIDITRMINYLKSQGYLVKAVVVTRDPYSSLHSQLKWRHIKNMETGEANISRAYLHIFRHLSKTGVDFTVVNYESLAFYPKAQDFLLEQLDLNHPERRWPVYDGNLKWHDKQANDTLANFPEAWYPCMASDPKVYFDRVRKGFQYMKSQSVIICGLARDLIKSLPIMMKRVESLGEKFKDYKVIIYENDSVDGTREMLLFWQRTNSKVEIISEQLNAPKWGSVTDLERMVQLAAYRNRYLDHIIDKSYQFDYLIVLDLDIPLGFSYDGIAHSFSHKHWDVMGSNGILVPPYGDPPPIPMFYDAFAFRQKGIDPADFETINALQFRRGEDLVPVESCFGGLAIYKSEGILAGAKYGGTDCEHVVLHQWLHKNGFNKQFINPNQLVLYSSDK